MLLESRMQQLLDEQVSLDEGILTEDTLDAYVESVCVQLESFGYEIPEEFELGHFVEALEAAVESDAALSEGFFAKAASAIKGAVSRGIAKLPKVVHRQLYKYHNKKADAAIDSGDKKAYMKHSGKAFRSLQVANPKSTAAQKLQAFHHAKSMGKQDPSHPEAKYVAPDSKQARSSAWKDTQRAKAEAGWYKKHGQGSPEQRRKKGDTYLKSFQRTHKGIPPEQQKTQVEAPPRKRYVRKDTEGSGTHAGTPSSLKRAAAKR